MFNVTIRSGEQIYNINASQGENLLDVIRKAGAFVNSPCNGNGTCGKCRVRILSGYLPGPGEAEVKLLGEDMVKAGWRLSCRYTIVSDAELLVEDGGRQAQIVTGGIHRRIELKPVVTREFISLEKPGLANQTADLERISGSSFQADNVNMGLIRAIPDIIRKNDFNISVVKMGTKLLNVEDSSRTQLYGAAFDIGTTTIAAYLVDLSRGERVCVHSLLNPQHIYGADVISRIQHTIGNESGLDVMNSLIIGAINNCIEAMCREAGISNRDIYAITFVGNTTMVHFLLKVSARNIAAAPFIPAVTSRLNLEASKLRIHINPCGIACVLPAVSAYIGADTVAAVLATGMHQQDEISLLIDIGTNGEIVLGGRNSLHACSSAAGPAFEGANIRNGMGSVRGAINSISLSDGMKFTTIGQTEPVGICGTGIVDGIAQMLEIGMIDETGRIDDGWKPASEVQAGLAANLTVTGNMKAFVISGDIAITQKDIRELQNAKAAIAAGIKILVKQSGISFDNISNVYLAGGFGTYMNIGNALKIGLIPSELAGKIKPAGNAAGQGAIEALLSEDSLAQACSIAGKIEYVELSGSKDFNDLYVDNMMFEQ